MIVVGLARLSSSSHIRPVIYRYIDVIKDSIALLEAIHFELFMPGMFSWFRRFEGLFEFK